mmetsp:Transcript_24329/g.53584  ORF Transcript_24329/g.53584 Transcript_24329/m.53584 type:complete len:132 (+) Transcript_24329:115-510(+)
MGMLRRGASTRVCVGSPDSNKYGWTEKMESEQRQQKRKQNGIENEHRNFSKTRIDDRRSCHRYRAAAVTTFYHVFAALKIEVMQCAWERLCVFQTSERVGGDGTGKALSLPSSLSGGRSNVAWTRSRVAHD